MLNVLNIMKKRGEGWRVPPPGEGSPASSAARTPDKARGRVGGRQRRSSVADNEVLHFLLSSSPAPHFLLSSS